MSRNYARPEVVSDGLYEAWKRLEQAKSEEHAAREWARRASAHIGRRGILPQHEAEYNQAIRAADAAWDAWREACREARMDPAHAWDACADESVRRCE